MDSPTNSGSSSEYTPPSSPARVLPASPLTPPLHSPGSPISRSSDTADESSSSSPQPPRKRRCTSKVSRTTLIRIQNSDCDSSDDDVENSAYPRTIKSGADQVERQTNHEQEEIGQLIEESDSSLSSSNSSSESSESSITDDPGVICSDEEADMSDNSRVDEVNGRETESEHSDSGEEDFLFQGSNLTTNEAILKALKVYISQRKTKTCLNADVRLIKSLLPEPNSFPSSAKSLFKKLESLSPFQKEVSHKYCSGCHSELVAGSSDECACGFKETCSFFEFPVDEQVRYMFEHRELATHIESYKARVPKDDCIEDILDGTEYKRIRSSLTGQYDLTLLLNTDGVKLAKSSKCELWGLLSVICEVHPTHRLSYLIVHGVFVATNKPNMNLFLKPFVDSMKSLYLNGGISWTHPVNNSVYTSTIVCPVLSADAPAKALVLNVKCFSHRFGCNICEQKAVKVKTSDESEITVAQQRNANQNKKKKATLRRFVYQETPAVLRAGVRMERQAELAEARGKTRKGVRGKAVVSELPFFDRGTSVCAEYMHTVLLGCVKYLVNIMLTERGPWYIGKHLTEIDEFIKSIKVPDFITRLPRGLGDILYFKASELRAFLLFYSLPAFKLYLPTEYFQHWMLLVAAINLLLKDCISNEDLTAAELLLRCFVRDIGVLYHNKYYTYNMHNLLHLPLLVRRWGPLWATSTFDFEKYNGYITSHVHGTKHLDKEFINNIKIIQSVVVFERSMQTVKTSANVGTVTYGQVKSLGVNLSPSTLDNFELLALEEKCITNFEVFDRVSVRRMVFTSKSYDITKRRSNSVVQFYHEDVAKFGEINHFIRNKDNGQVMCLITLFKTKHVDIFYLHDSLFKIKHILPVENTGQLIILPVSCLVTKVIKAAHFLCLRPNPYEVNL